jgi:hypothetical protein
MHYWKTSRRGGRDGKNIEKNCKEKEGIGDYVLRRKKLYLRNLQNGRPDIIRVMLLKWILIN